jgi:hypothetical protein
VDRETARARTQVCPAAAEIDVGLERQDRGEQAGSHRGVPLEWRARRRRPAHRARRHVIHVLIAVTIVASVPAAALASLGGVPHARSVCVRERTVLRPEVQSADRMKPELREGTRLVPVRVCAEERRACYASDEEISMSRCETEE